ncbi:class I SAM-dependent methyltransferase [soil metagenome]
MTKIHEAAAVGFERAADAYERGRPEYSADAVEFVRAKLAELQKSRLNDRSFSSPTAVDGPRGLAVADVAAGTGKFTKVLASFSPELVATIAAVEPVAAMRTKCVEILTAHLEDFANSPATSRVAVLDGTAEKLPFADESLDVVTVAQAFHWFDGAQALVEIHRVMRPGGMLLMIWNVRDESFAWIREMTDLMVPYEGTAPRYRTMKWREAFDHQFESPLPAPLFSPLEMTSIKHVTLGTIETMLDRVASVSFVASLPLDDRTELLSKMRDLYLRELRSTASPAEREEPQLAMPYEAQVFICRGL